MKEKRPFKNLRVVDFTWIGVGTFIIKYLTDYGAETIKIESENRPDPIRLLPPFKDGTPHIEGSYIFGTINTSKYSVKLSLSHPKGVEVAKRLISRADIVAENFTPGVMERIGLGYEELRKVKPDIIMVSAGTQGQTGPHAKAPGTGMTLTSLAGFNYITGWPDRTPVGVYGPYTDYISPLFGAAALHAALDYQQRTGKGQYLDLSQFEACIHFLSPLVLDYAVNKRLARRMGNQSPYAAPHGIYRCSGEDRWCAIAVQTDEEWKSFCKVLGDPEQLQNPKFATIVGRLENRNELDELVEAWTIKSSPEEVMRLLQEVGVPAGIVETGEDSWNDPQLRHYNSILELEHPVMGSCIALRKSVELSKMSYELKRPPLLGEHTEYVCKQVLEMPDEEFVELLQDGVFE